jgi:hypothetical protein
VFSIPETRPESISPSFAPLHSPFPPNSRPHFASLNYRTIELSNYRTILTGAREMSRERSREETSAQTLAMRSITPHREEGFLLTAQKRPGPQLRFSMADQGTVRITRDTLARDDGGGVKQ